MSFALAHNPSAFESLHSHIERYPALPKEAVVKQDVLRKGLNFSKDALRIAKGYKPKDYFIFSFDLIELKNMEQQENWRAPEEIRLHGGPLQFLPTIISTRINPNSPYLVELLEGKLSLTLEGHFLGEIDYHPIPDYYKKETIQGKPIGEICPVIEWGYLIYLTAYRLCQYFNQKEQCQFCDLNTNYKQQKQSGRVYTGIKSLDEILEGLDAVNQYDQTAKAYTLTGGSIITGLKNQEEVDFYVSYAETINKRFSNRWISKAVVQAWPQEDCQKLKDAGVQIYHPNYEVWGKEKFAAICPGKERVIGFENWIQRILDSAKVFGPENVIPNFVGGVELNNKTGFTTIEEAIQSTTEGLDFFMSHGIVPRFTTWCPEPLAALGPQESAPLDYFCQLLLAWKATFEKYKLPIPQGYGEPGPGKAVFSVSAFMDVIGYEA